MVDGYGQQPASLLARHLPNVPTPAPGPHRDGARTDDQHADDECEGRQRIWAYRVHSITPTVMITGTISARRLRRSHRQPDGVADRSGCWGAIPGADVAARRDARASAHNGGGSSSESESQSSTSMTIVRARVSPSVVGRYDHT